MSTKAPSKAIVGEKVGMTQLWDDQNNVVPVTVVKVPPARVVQVKTPERDGYAAIQVTYGQVRPEPPQQARARTLRQARASSPAKRSSSSVSTMPARGAVGQEIAADTFAAGDLVDVTAASQGQGLRRHR